MAYTPPHELIPKLSGKLSPVITDNEARAPKPKYIILLESLPNGLTLLVRNWESFDPFGGTIHNN